MADVIAQLEVLSQKTGCLLDLTALIDLSVCTKIDIKAPASHHTEEKDDHIYVTPTKDEDKSPVYDKRSCDDGACYEISDAVCQKSAVAIDLELLVVIGLLTEQELEDYSKATGAIGEDDCVKVEDCNVKMDPLLSVNVGGKNGLLDLEVAGEDGLVNLKLGGSELLKIGRRDEHREGEDSVAIDGLVNPRSLKGRQLPAGALSNRGLMADEARTLDRRTEGCKADKDHDSMLSHYQPICQKGFKKEHRDKAHHCQASDVNHCLAVCNAESALLTINADVKVGDLAEILLCVAIEFDQSAEGDNCHFFVAPEHEPCTDDHLEDSDECYTFFRN